MAKESGTQEEASQKTQGDRHSSSRNLLGPILCWAVVFADIGTSVYYVPGILWGTLGITTLAGFFVFLTMAVFVLLTLKYAEVSYRFPQGGGVVTVASQAINHWVGALCGIFILVYFFLTAAISCLSGMLYLSVVIPGLNPIALWVTLGVLVLLGILNWVGISESARVSFVGAVIAFLSDIAILVTVFTHISFGEFLSLFPRMFANHSLAPTSILIGFAASFLAFSGLESISQLSPVMKVPRRRTAGMALLLVVASNTAIIGSYHVFMALARMEFFPAFILKRNKLRDTPHYSIALAAGIPIIILLAVQGRLDLLGDLYAFGLLGAFSLTCLGLDIIRRRERKAARAVGGQLSRDNGHVQAPPQHLLGSAENLAKTDLHANGPAVAGGLDPEAVAMLATPTRDWRMRLHDLWYNVDFWLGILTTFLVVLAWTTNLIYKHLATEFGSAVTALGMLVAYINYARYKQKGRLPVVTTGLEGRLPGSILAVVSYDNPQNDAVVRAALNHADGKPVVFLYVGEPKTQRVPTMFEFVDPYHDDQQAKETFSVAESIAQKAKIPRRYVYRQDKPGVVASVWQVIHPHDTVLSPEDCMEVVDVNPDRIRYEITPDGKVAHLLKRWSL